MSTRRTTASATTTATTASISAPLARGRRRLALGGAVAASLLAAACTGCTLPPPPGGGTPTTTSPGSGGPGGGGGTGTGSVAPYEIGSPVLTDVWLDPVHGDDAQSGNDRAHALRTMHAAWGRVPADTAGAPTGTRIRITPGTVPVHSLPNNWYEAKRGTAAKPIVIAAADGRGTVTIEGGMNLYDVRYVYVLDLRMVAGGAAPATTDLVLHVELGDHVLVRGNTFIGDRVETKETIKFNQSRFVYVEDNDISGAWDNPIDVVAVQDGHLIRNKVHGGDDWCAYVKGGSARWVVDSNELYDCGVGGFTAGQGSGFEWMQAPWLHYETYGIEVTNNVIHDTDGAGLGVNGGYNILMAHNTMYRVGARSHVIEVVFGGRGCDGEAAMCADHWRRGGWGPNGAGGEEYDIPNNHVAIVNNVVWNPAGFRSAWQHFAVANPQSGRTSAHLPATVRADDDLRIAGNVIWNGPVDHPLGIDFDVTCRTTNITCSEAQLRSQNAINTVEPRLVNPAGGDFRLTAPVAGLTSAPIPAIVWTDAPTSPDLRGEAPVRTDAVTRTRSGGARPATGAEPGAL